MNEFKEEPDEEIVQRLSSISKYYAGCLKAIGAKNKGLKDVRNLLQANCPVDIGLLLEEEQLFTNGSMSLKNPQTEDSDPKVMAAWQNLRTLHSKHESESFQKEALYGFPILNGVYDARGKSDSAYAPLFLQSVKITANKDGSFLVKPTEEPLRFNSALWKYMLDSNNEKQIVSFGLELQNDITSNGFDKDRISDFMKAIKGIMPSTDIDHLIEDYLLRSWDKRMTMNELKASKPFLEMHSSACLFLANKSSPFLLKDLETIADNAKDFLKKDNPVKTFISDPSSQIREETRTPEIDEVCFPFYSNKSQRRVADAFNKNNILVVQGPPGNGKSLTIANVVCDLVSQGKKVLVTSHKDQALTVIQDKLAETKLKFLYASLINGSAEAKKNLRGQIDDLKVFNGETDSDDVKEDLEFINEARKESAELYRNKQKLYIDKISPDQERLSELMEKFNNQYSLNVLDNPELDENQFPKIIKSFQEIDRLTREYKNKIDWLEKVGIKTSSQCQEIILLLNEFIVLQESRIKVAGNQFVQELIKKWHDIAETFPEQIEASEKVLSESENLVEPFNSLIRYPNWQALLDYCFLLRDSNISVLDSLKQQKDYSSEIIQELIRLENFRNIISVDPSKREDILSWKDHSSGGWNIWAKKNAKEYLGEHAPEVLEENEENIEYWAEFWDYFEKLQELNKVIPEQVRFDLSEYNSISINNEFNRLQQVIYVTEWLLYMMPIFSQTQMVIPEDQLYKGEGINQNRILWKTALEALKYNDQGNNLIHNSKLVFAEDILQNIDTQIDTHKIEEAQKELAVLKSIVEGLNILETRNSYLESIDFEKSKQEVIDNINEGEPPPKFMIDLEASLKNHPEAIELENLRQTVSSDLISSQLVEMRNDVLEKNKDYLELQIKSRIKNGFRKPTFISSLETFKKSFSASAKRGQDIEEMKNSPSFDIESLTDVFPCWIMRPDDVCRNFPLQEGIFDVVIFDEASQCNPDQALPLFLRGKSVAVFGDDKQLPNMFMLDESGNKTILQQSGMDKLDESIKQTFDQKKDSLLGLVNSRTQETITLNEHFRCRPEIITFSNKEYYGSSLKIMRDSHDTKGLGPAFLTIELDGVPATNKFASVHAPDKDAQINPYEAYALVDFLEDILTKEIYKDMSIGIMSVFREQTEFLSELISERIPDNIRNERKILCSTADGFQGDERDIILYSWRYSGGRNNLGFTSGDGNGGNQRMNVALTRARHQAIHFISAPINKFPSRLPVYKYLKHVQNPEFLVAEANKNSVPVEFDELRKDISEKLIQAGYIIEENYIAGGILIDILVKRPEDNALAGVFVDSSLPKRIKSSKRIVDHMDLERSGWSIVRISPSDILSGIDIKEKIDTALNKSNRKTIDQNTLPEYQLIPAPELNDWMIMEGEEGIADENNEFGLADSPDYNWKPLSVPERINSGEKIFYSDFERELYDYLESVPNVKTVPQWPACGKHIDFVLTDNLGRRIALEADGEIYHQDSDGNLSEEDVERQELLENQGWEFHRINYKDWQSNPDGEIQKALATLFGSNKTRPQLTGFSLAESLPGSRSAQVVDEINEAEDSDDLTVEEFKTSQIEEIFPNEDFNIEAEESLNGTSISFNVPENPESDNQKEGEKDLE